MKFSQYLHWPQLS